MTKEELVTLAERCWATWNQQPHDQRSAYEAWWRLLSDLSVDHANEVIDRLAVSTNYCPRPGELRRLVIGDDAPSDSDAWSQYRKLDSAINHGTQVPEVHPLVRDTVRKVGAGLHTNGDRQFFLDAYGEVVSVWRQKRYAP